MTWPWKLAEELDRTRVELRSLYAQAKILREAYDSKAAEVNATTGEVLYLREQNRILIATLSEISKPGVTRAVASPRPAPKEKEDVPAAPRDVLPGI